MFLPVWGLAILMGCFLFALWSWLRAASLADHWERKYWVMRICLIRAIKKHCRRDWLMQALREERPDNDREEMITDAR